MLTETVDTTKQKLDECKEVLKTNENGMCESEFMAKVYGLKFKVYAEFGKRFALPNLCGFMYINNITKRNICLSF